MNINLEYPFSDERKTKIAEEMDAMDFGDMSRHFKQRRCRYAQGRWSWQQQRLGIWVSSFPDYFLGRDAVWKKLRWVEFRQLRHHDLDHRVVVGLLYLEAERKLRQYRQRRKNFPLHLPRIGPRQEGDVLFKELQGACGPPPARERPAKNWISKRTWHLVDRRAKLQKRGRLSQVKSRRLGREINASLKSDRWQRVEDVMDKIEGCLLKEDLQEAWRHAKGWYWLGSSLAPKPCYQTMERQTKEREELYRKQELN